LNRCRKLDYNGLNYLLFNPPGTADLFRLYSLPDLGTREKHIRSLGYILKIENLQLHFTTLLNRCG